jgi:hypothetical protein
VMSLAWPALLVVGDAAADEPVPSAGTVVPGPVRTAG